MGASDCNTNGGTLVHKIHYVKLVIVKVCILYLCWYTVCVCGGGVCACVYVCMCTMCLSTLCMHTMCMCLCILCVCVCVCMCMSVCVIIAFHLQSTSRVIGLVRYYHPNFKSYVTQVVEAEGMHVIGTAVFIDRDQGGTERVRRTTGKETYR